MAIKYLAGNRIQGTNTERTDLAVSTSTDEDIQDETWTKSHSDLTQGSSYIQWANMTGGTENGYYDIGTANISDTWKLQFKATVSSYTTGTQSHSRWCSLGLSSTSSTMTGSQDSINVIFRTNTSSDTIAGTRTNDQALNGQLGTAGISGVTLGNGTFYVTLERTSATDYKVEVRTGSHSGTLLGTGSYTNGASTLTGLRYIKTGRLNQSSADGNFVIKFEEIDLTTYTTDEGIVNLETNSIFEESDTGEHYLRAKYGWYKFGDTGSMPNHRGIFTGGYNSTAIDYITIATLGNGTDFGDGGSQGKAGAGVSNGTLGILGGDDNVLNQVTIATTANSTDFGDLTGIGGNATACADATRGVWFRGNINYITMASASNATDWGHDRSPNAGDPCAFADTTRGIVAGGETNVGGWHDINDMDYITIQTISSTTDFGDMTDVKRQLSGVANDTYGFTMCGYNGSSFLSTIDYVTICTLGNASSFGTLTQARTAQNSACGDSTRAVLGGGYATSSNSNVIDYFTMGTSGNASDFGDLTSARTRVMSCSDYVK